MVIERIYNDKIFRRVEKKLKRKKQASIRITLMMEVLVPNAPDQSINILTNQRIYSVDKEFIEKITEENLPKIFENIIKKTTEKKETKTPEENQEYII